MQADKMNGRGWPPSYRRSTEVCCQSATVLGLLHTLKFVSTRPYDRSVGIQHTIECHQRKCDNGHCALQIYPRYFVNIRRDRQLFSVSSERHKFAKRGKRNCQSSEAKLLQRDSNPGPPDRQSNALTHSATTTRLFTVILRFIYRLGAYP